MDVNRRSFLKLFSAAAVAPKYFFAPVGGWKSNVIVNPLEVMSPPSAVFSVHVYRRLGEVMGVSTSAPGAGYREWRYEGHEYDSVTLEDARCINPSGTPRIIIPAWGAWGTKG